MALKLGTVDGAVFGLENLEIYKLKEVWKNFVFTPSLNTLMACLIINMDSFKKLPANIRALIDNNAHHVLLETAMNSYVWDLYWSAKASKEHPFKLVRWSEEDISKVRKVGFGLWDTVAAKSPRCAKWVDIIRTQMRELGKI